MTALRSGDWPQTRGVLHRIKSIYASSPVGFCCLGVACEVAIKQGLALERVPLLTAMRYGSRQTNRQHGSTTATLPDEVMDWFGFAYDNPPLKVPDEVACEIDDAQFPGERESCSGLWNAAQLNDDLHFTLAQIGDCFEYTYLPQDWEVTRAAR